METEEIKIRIRKIMSRAKLYKQLYGQTDSFLVDFLVNKITDLILELLKSEREKARQETIEEILNKIDTEIKDRDITIYELGDWLLKLKEKNNNEKEADTLEKIMKETEKGFIKYAKENLMKDIEILERTIEVKLDYCKKQNGLSHCKNCGLSHQDLLLAREIKEEIKNFMNIFCY